MMARGRSKGFFTTMVKEAARAQREAEQRQRRALAEQAKVQREMEQARVAAERAAHQRAVAADKAERQRILDDGVQRAAEWTKALQARIWHLEQILPATLAKDDTIPFDSLRHRESPPPFVPPAELAQPFPAPASLRWLDFLRPGAEQRYRQAVAEHEAAEERRRMQLQSAWQYHQREVVGAWHARVSERDAEVADFEAAYREGSREAIIAYNTLVLERSQYPPDFPKSFRVTYAPDSRQLVVDYELPGPSIIPVDESYSYVRTRNEVVPKARKQAEIRERYLDVVASVTLRTIHEVFEADQGRHLQAVTFNGFAQSVDRATGKDVVACLVSVRTTRERFLELNLARVDKRVCLRNLGAQVSPQPSELQPVKPVVEFDMVDKRFVDQADVLAELDARPNLMDLTPAEFEALVSNLFQKMGLETKLTRTSRDGGVDAVAFDTRPVIGGKIVIQAKRYRHTVGVSAVRDLAGTMDHERANKGILVTTSGYGPDAFSFASGKPIELIDGGNLLYLLEQVGVKARIIMPDEG